MKRRRVVMAVATVAVAALAAAQVMAAIRVRHNEDSLVVLRRERATVDAAALVARQASADPAGALDELGRRLGVAADDLTAAQVGLVAKTAERDTLRTALVGLQAQVGQVRGGIAAADRAGQSLGAQVTAFQTCLAGVGAATGRLRAGDQNGAVGALQRATSACQEAAAYLAKGQAPVFPWDFADPFVLRSGGTFYAYSTNGGGGDLQLATSTDLRTWQPRAPAMPRGDMPAWAVTGFTWAPSVVVRGPSYVAYYAVRERTTGRQCISRAVATSPLGPFVDRSPGPFLCQRDQGGSIDPSVFTDATGALYLTWKSEGEAVGAPAHLWAQRLSDDGSSLVGPAADILHADQTWERGTVEGPSMVHDGATYYLFYSGGSWTTAAYSIGYARCAGPLGPCAKPTAGPVLSSFGTAAGPGGQDAFRDGNGQLWLSFHAFTTPNVGYPNPRTLRLAKLGFSGGRPVIDV